MNTTITKRELITHELKWFWKKPELRKEIRHWSETGPIEHAPAFAVLPDFDELHLWEVLETEPEAWSYKALQEYAMSDIYALYRYVFLQDERCAVQVDVSPMTDKLGRYILPYVGVMVVYAIADRMIEACRHNRLVLSADADLWVRQLRWMAARRLHLFTKKLTRLKADAVPTYGVCVQERSAQLYLRHTCPNLSDVALAKQTYPGQTIPTYHVRMDVSPIAIRFAHARQLDQPATQMAS